MLQRLFAPRPARAAGKSLYTAAARQARDPAFYTRLGAPDTGEGRFELYSLHVGLIVLRLKGQGEAAAETAQALFDVFVRELDDALREMGVGDLAVGKRMRRLGEAFYGRVRSFDDALASDGEAVEALLKRTVFAGVGGEGAPALAAYLAGAREALADQPLEQILRGQVDWPEVT